MLDKSRNKRLPFKVRGGISVFDLKFNDVKISLDMIQWTCHIKALSITERSLTMSEKRKDNKGRILRTGESQRKDLIYQYRYTDIRGKRQTIYSSDLKELREKEKTIQKQLDDGIDYAAGKITVLALLERYISFKKRCAL